LSSDASVHTHRVVPWPGRAVQRGSSGVSRRRHPRLDRNPDRGSDAVRVDRDRRPHPRINRPLLHTNQRISTLDLFGESICDQRVGRRALTVPRLSRAAMSRGC
jgi:hypothetical protein